MTDSFSLKIITPKGVVLEDKASFLRVPGITGEIGVYPSHSATLSLLKAGECQATIDGVDHFYFVPKGWAHVTETQVTLLVDYLELSSEIDKERATASLERATDRLSKQEDEPCDINRAKVSIAKAEARLDIFKNRR